MISHLLLNTKKILSKNCTLQMDSTGHEFIIIEHPKFDAAFSLQGGHLIHFQVKHKKPLIYLSKTALYNESKAIRGGVPICWPWFGPADNELGENLPSHGFARVNKWQVSDLNENEEGVNIEFSLAPNQATKALWNNEFSLTLKASLSEQLSLSLITTNTSTKDFSYRAALHTYLNIADITHCSINGLAMHYLDSLSRNEQISKNKKVTISAPVDSIYQANQGDIIVDDHQHQRTISISNSGNDSVVVWNPWKDGAAAFSDMPDQDYQTMLCIESAITSKEGCLIKMGETHTLTTTVK